MTGNGVERDEQQVVAERVARNDPGVLHGEEVVKVLEADPGTAEHSLRKVVVLESDDHPHHGEVAVDQGVNHGDGQHQEQLSGMKDVLKERSLLARHPHRLNALLRQGRQIGLG